MLKRTITLSLLSLVAGGMMPAGAIIPGLNPGANTLAANDDGSGPETSIGFTVNYFGTSYTTLFANNNGNLTFVGDLATFTPFGLSGATSRPIIAAFFADVDTRGAGSGLLTYGATTLTTDDAVLRNAFVANYINVGYFASQTDKLNSFQIVLIDRSDTGAGNFDIMFNYDGVQWETGAASGGTGGLGGSSARVGFSNGTGNPGSFFEFVGSGVNGAFIDGGPNALISSSNVIPGNPLYTRTDGRYVFTVRGGSVDVGVPEPSTWALAVAGLAALAWRKRQS